MHVLFLASTGIPGMTEAFGNHVGNVRLYVF